MFKVFITDKLSDKGVAVFKAEPDFQADVYPTPSPADLKKAVSVVYDALGDPLGHQLRRGYLEAAKDLKSGGPRGCGAGQCGHSPPPPAAASS